MNQTITTLEDAKTFLAEHGGFEVSALFRPVNTAQLIAGTPRGSLVQVLHYLGQNPPEVHEDGAYEIEFTENKALQSITNRKEIELLIKAAASV